MNNLLKTLYENHIHSMNDFKKQYEHLNLNGPLLLKINDYTEQSIKLMIIGQETYGWNDSENLNDLLKTYEGFNFGEKYYSSPFWNITRKIETILNIKKYSIAWSNLNRFDVNEKSPDKTEIKNKINTFDHLLKEEIKILKPDVCIFFTNHKYDWRLKNLYQDLNFNNIEGLRNKHFCKLSHPELPKYTIRAPHPRTIRTQKWEENFINYIEQIKSEINLF